MRAFEFIQRKQAIDQTLDEVAMSPGSLKGWASSKEAEGMLAGFEAELVFPNSSSVGTGDFELEPDYTEDPFADSIEEVIDFHASGEFSTITRNGPEASSARDQMLEDFLEWRDGKIKNDWDEVRTKKIIEFVQEEDLFDTEEEIEEIKKQFKDQGEKEPDDLTSIVKEKFKEFIKQIIQEEFENGIYENAYSKYYDDKVEEDEYTESDWLGYRRMSILGARYDLEWPHYRQDQDYEGGEFDPYAARELADDLEKSLGVNAKVETTSDKDGVSWYFEPDASVHASDDDPLGLPVEIVSPPMPLGQTLEMFEKFSAWVDKHDGYSNKTTGLHMSVSMPDHQDKPLDYVKLALFLGDDYVLEKFGRELNSMTTGTLRSIRSRKISQENEVKAALEKMRSKLDYTASRLIANDLGLGKFFSINPKTKYIEFRSAGNENYFGDIDKIKNTLMRYARATSIAMNPEAEKQEYAKKFYKLLANVETEKTIDPKTGSMKTIAKTNNAQDPIWFFSRYVAGTLPQQALKSFIRQIQVQRQAQQVKKEQPNEIDKDTPNQSGSNIKTYYVVYSGDPYNDGRKIRHRVDARSPEEARIIFAARSRDAGVDTQELTIHGVET